MATTIAAHILENGGLLWKLLASNGRKIDVNCSEKQITLHRSAAVGGKLIYFCILRPTDNFRFYVIYKVKFIN